MSNKKQALFIISQLRKQGFEALFAGGCVRDMLLGRQPKDYDVATNAAPQQIMKLFRRTLKVGAQFGVVIVLMDNQQVEVATFRSDVGYADGRHPDKVEFVSAKEDALRRDFTVNGMFYDPIAKEVLDYVGGRKDLQHRILRTIGKADERFGEDYLRMLRAVRFAVQLDFRIEPATWRAVCRLSGKITNISTERIAAELQKTVTYPNKAHGGKLLIESGLTREIWPKANVRLLKQGVEVLSGLPKQSCWPLSAAALFVAFDENTAKACFQQLKPSGEQIKHFAFLLKNKGRLSDALSLAELKTLASSPYWQDLLALEKAVLKAQGKSLKPLLAARKRLAMLKDASLKPKPLLDGHQILALGAVPGPMVGAVSRDLYTAQLNEKIHTAAQAKEFVLHWIKNHK